MISSTDFVSNFLGRNFITFLPINSNVIFSNNIHELHINYQKFHIGNKPYFTVYKNIRLSPLRLYMFEGKINRETFLGNGALTIYAVCDVKLIINYSIYNHLS